MTSTMFASLGPSIFAVVVAKRQAHVTASKAVDALINACQCDRGCRCALVGPTRAAKQVEGAAYADLRAAEDSYREYLAIRRLG